MCSLYQVLTAASVLLGGATAASAKGGWSDKPTQYHIQTDEGPERFFRYQTLTGQYRKEKRLEDGTVVGTYGWVDPNGIMSLRDYIADNAGYRIVKTRKFFVGNAGTKEADAPGLPTVEVTAAPIPTTTAAPPTTQRPIYRAPPTVYPTYNTNVAPTTYRPPIQALYDSSPQYDHRPDGFNTRPPYERPYQDNVDQNSVYQPYDGVSTYQNGFRYYLPRQYHEEETSPAAGGDVRTGSFGYIDPFGIRRVVYYNTAPGTGFLHRKNNRYVGFNATPYDPRY
ncbi:hypothetical protein J437_LFUL011833 [Ladona fulva]|uniref:Cuticle protein n=1 Tax=Ladona fulva TaxID=123851 RepID=A0A8K0K402_LADFU|nr:hypothetical protein J437_LFUL011833 [Ladona fulva]